MTQYDTWAVYTVATHSHYAGTAAMHRDEYTEFAVTDAVGVSFMLVFSTCTGKRNARVGCMTKLMTMDQAWPPFLVQDNHRSLKHGPTVYRCRSP